MLHAYRKLEFASEAAAVNYLERWTTKRKPNEGRIPPLIARRGELLDSVRQTLSLAEERDAFSSKKAAKRQASVVGLSQT